MPPAARKPRTVLAAVVAVALLVIAAVAASGLGNPLHDFSPHHTRAAVTVVCAVLGLSIIAALLLRPSPARPRRLGWMAMVVSSLCVLATAFIWVAVGTGHSLDSALGSRVSTQDQATAVLARQGYGEKRQIRTGVMIETMEFTGANNVRLTGFLWQHLPAGEDVTRPEVEFPDAIDGGVGDEFYRDETPEGQVVGWRLKTTLREAFDYTHYPLDNQAVWLVMWPRAVDTVLVPDFSAYPPWDPDENYGIYSGLVGGDWKAQFTTYGMAQDADRTTYGRPQRAVDGTHSELTYSIGVGRQYLSPLLNRLVPLLVIALLVFGSLFVITTDSDRRSLSGFTTWAVIGFCGSMMLVVSVQHSGLRAETQSDGVVYAEYFYFILYLVIGLVALNAIEHTANKTVPVVDWRGNAAARLLYWPVVTILLLIATVFGLLL
ncbi:hypothetical protein H9Y04_11045 [Streptomyces sp. TRM66268-LWL]|uniref:DUF4178 domain-containing protein n=1 Tax=Streptomyces polyasparticus TaxID=2767826 RepID=A0ABR7SCA0_9ACTN|nr:hypothetical protein [Streptomyces polyasparticus]MBC9713106.1 hypothetical protein [Streptomyces polyasparticus]